MISHSGYRVPDGEPAPFEAPLLVMSAGHYRFETMAHFHTDRPHGRDDYQLLYIAGGTADFTVQGRRYRLGEGSMVLYEPYEAQDYVYRADKRPEIYWIHFTGTAVAALLAQLGLCSGVYAVGVDSRYGELTECVIRELQLRRPWEHILTASLLSELLTRMARVSSEARGTRPRSATIERAVEEIERRFAEPLSVADLAALFHMEVCWFSRLFRRQMGVSPQQYLIRVRMAKARELLGTTDCAVSEVARLTGYDNPLYFSRAFSKLYGCSPREYRRQLYPQTKER